MAACYFAAGSLRVALAQPVLEPSVTSVPTPAVLEFDPAHAILPHSKLTPGDTFPGVTASDVCTPGWASEHRHVTEEMRDRVFEEYRRVEGPDCCKLDHLIPLELGGSNDIKNLWPQPDKPLPGWADKDDLENELHAEVCEGTLTLSDAQHCIASKLGGVLAETRVAAKRNGHQVTIDGSRNQSHRTLVVCLSGAVYCPNCKTKATTLARSVDSGGRPRSPILLG